jgi:uncharacterized protein
MTMRATLSSFFTVLVLAFVTPESSAQSALNDAFILKMGTDTLAVERFGAFPGRLEGEIVGNAFGRTIYEMSHFDGKVTELLLQTWRPGNFNASPSQTASIRMIGDSVVVRLSSASGTVDQRIATTPGAIPYINPSIAQLDFALQYAGDRDSLHLPLFLIQGGITLDATFSRHREDSVSFLIAGSILNLALDDDGAVRAGNIPSQNIRISRDASADFPADARSAPDYSAPADAPYSAETVEVTTTAGHRLVGTLTKPGHSDRLPAVVMITGSGPQDRDQAIPGIIGYRPFRDISDALSRGGIAVLRLDDRGVGESTGDFRSATSEDFADDISDAVSYLRSRPDIDPARIALIGHSEGGLIAPMVAATDESIAGIVLIAGPAQTGREIIAYQIRSAVLDGANGLSEAEIDSLILAQHAEIDAMSAGNPWMRFFLDYDPLATARSVQSVPVLIVHGETDLQVTIEQAEILAAAFREGGNSDVTVEELPEVNHLLLRDADGHPSRYTTLVDRTVVPEVLQAIGRWLGERLAPEPDSGIDR